jgi:S1-C subfamily serine protease
MSIAIPRPARRDSRAVLALTTALSLGAAAVLVAPAAALGAQGDDEVVIGVIERAAPSVVTIQAQFGQSAGQDEAQPDEDGAAEDDSSDEQVPQSLEELEDLLPEGFRLPDGLEFPENDDQSQDFQLPEGFRIPEGFDIPEGFSPGGSGSGVIIGSDGLIITNGHVVGDAEDVTVILQNGDVLDGRVTGVDTLTDFAFVQVDAQDLPAVTLGDSSALRVGQTAIAVGNPLGTFPGSVSVGIVSGLDRSISAFTGLTGGERLNHLIQTDAAVNSGNSGGALFDGDGNLIGIITAEAGMSDGIGFALPIDLAKPIITQAAAGEDIARPYVGVVFREIDAQVAEEEDLPVTAGAWIAGAESEDAIVADSPADEAGLEEGDIITAVDGVPVDRDNPLDLQVLRFAPGDEVTLQVLRDGETLDLSATLGTRPADLRQ